MDTHAIPRQYGSPIGRVWALHGGLKNRGTDRLTAEHEQKGLPGTVNHGQPGLLSTSTGSLRLASRSTSDPPGAARCVGETRRTHQVCVCVSFFVLSFPFDWFSLSLSRSWFGYICAGIQLVSIGSFLICGVLLESDSC